MRRRPARRLHRFSPRTAAVLTCVGAALCGATPVHGEVMPGGPQPGVMLEHAPVRGQSPAPNRNAAAIVGLAEAAAFQEKIGRERIAARGRALAQRVRAGLAAIKGVEILSPAAPELSAAMVTLRVVVTSCQP